MRCRSQISESNGDSRAVALDPSGNAPRQPHVRLLLPAFDLDARELTGFEQLGKSCFCIGRGQAKVISQISQRRDPERLSGRQQQLAMRFVGGTRDRERRIPG